MAKRKNWIATHRKGKDDDIAYALLVLGIPNSEEDVSQFIRMAMRREIHSRIGKREPEPQQPKAHLTAPKRQPKKDIDDNMKNILSWEV